MFSIFQKFDHTQKKQKTETYSQDEKNKIDDSLEESVLEDRQDLQLDGGGELTMRNLKIKHQKQLYYQNALQLLQIPQTTTKGNQKTYNSEEEAEMNLQSEEDQEEQYGEALKNYSKAHKINFSEMFHVVHKDDFEMLEMYTDQEPLLQVRKQILWVMKFISYLCFRLIKSKPFENAVLCIILFNTVTLMMVDPTVTTQTPLQDQFDNFFLIAYTVEMSCKIVGLGFVLNKGSYLRDGWNMLDFVIVVSSLLPLILGGNKSVNLTSLRSLRILRPLRTISSIKALQLILTSLFSAIPFLIDTFIVLFFYFLIFAIAGLQLFKGVLKQRCIDPSNGINYFQGDEEFMCGGSQDCNPGPGGASGTNYGNGTFICGKMLKNPYHGQNFDNIFYSLLLVFQSATLEGWSNTMYWIAQSVSVYTLAYHLVLVFVGANVIINLTLAVIKAKFSDSQMKASMEKNIVIVLEEDLDQDEIDQKRIEDEEIKKQEKEKSSSSSGEEEIPSLEMQKKHHREARLKVRDHNQILQDLKLNQAGQSKDLNFVYEDLMALKEQNVEDDALLAQQAKQQQILDSYMDNQKKQMQKIFKKSAKKKAINKAKLQPSTRTIKINSSKNGEPVSVLHILSPRAVGFRSDRKGVQKTFLKRNSSIDPDLPIMRKSKRDMTTIQVTNEDPPVPKIFAYGNENSKNSELLPSYSSQKYVSINDRSQSKDGAPKLIRTDKRRSTRKQQDGKQERLHSSHNKEEFDIILQDLDDLPPLDEIAPPTKASKFVQQKKKMMLRGTRVKLESYDLKTIPQSQVVTMIEPMAEQYSEILSNSDNDEDNQVKVRKQIQGSKRSIKLKLPMSEDEDSDDLFNDPDFREDEQIDSNKDHALAQALLQQRYNSRPVKKKDQTQMLYGFGKNNPKIKGFLIHGLQEHLKRLSQQKVLIDQKVNNQMLQELIQHTNDDNGDYNAMELDLKQSKIGKKEKIQKKGQSQDYKLVLTIDHEYFSSSKNDVMEKILIKKAKETHILLLQKIKNQKYTFFYAVYEELPVKKTKQDISRQKKKVLTESQHINDDSLNEQYKNSKHGSVTSKQFDHLHASTMGINDNFYKDGSQTIQNNAIIAVSSTVRVPVTKGGQIRRQLYLKLKKQNQFDENIDILLQLDKSVNKSMMGDKTFNQTNMGQSSYHKSTTMKKRRANNVVKEDYDLSTYSSAKKAFNEKNEEQIIPFELPIDKLYLQLLQLDYLNYVKSALHWSGEEVMITQGIPAKRANKIRQKIDSANQNKVIYLAGIMGFLTVRHNELKEFVKGKFVNNFLLLVVIGNTVLLSLAGTFTSDRDLALLETCNTIFTYIFISEMGLKLIAFGPAEYLRDRMNIFDGSIVLLSIMEMTLLTGAKGKAVSAFRAIRIFRVLRITRLLRSMKFMGVIVKVVNQTLENFIYICFLMFLFVIIYSLLGMQIYGGKMAYRGNSAIPQNWDNFLYAFLATFQGLTIENWDDLLQITLQSSVNKFLSVIYFISWVIIGNYVFLNLFLAILMDGFCGVLDDEESAEAPGTSEDQHLMNVLSNALLTSNKELALQKKKTEYMIELEKKKIGIQNQPGTQNVSLQTSIIEDEVEQDLVKQTTKINKPLYDGIECESSLFMFDKESPIRIFCYRLVTNHDFEQLILGFIVASSFKLAIDTYLDSNSAVGDVSQKIDVVINVVFIFECALKIIGFGFFIDENSYLTESWSQLDFFIVCTSLIDMLFSNVNIPVIKILRLLRILRPLRFISHNVNLKTIVIALFESLGGMLNVMIVVGLVWLMFAILGISLLGGKFGWCVIQGNPLTPNFGINIHDCTLTVGNKWFNFLPNMDNVYNAMTFVFILTTLEGWPNILYPAMNSDTPDKGPQPNINQYVSFYFVGVILASSFILINLFTGVVCYYFEQASKNEKKRGNIFLTQEQENWIEIQTMTIGVEAGQNKKEPDNKIRAAIFWFVEQGIINTFYNILGKFDAFVMICICLNILTMAMDYEGSTIKYNSILENVNLGFTSVFIGECISKLIAFGIKDYLSSGWNKFDLFVVTTSVLDIGLNLAGGNAVSFLRVGPQLIRIVRVLRVTRLLKLIKSMKSLQKLLQTLLYSLPALLNIGALTFLVFFIFSILGVFLFQNEARHDLIISYNNFENFGLAMITLYRASTGENWEWVMYDYTSNQVFAPLYFMIFLIVSTWVMLNLFTLVIIQYFENYSMKSDNPLEVFTDSLDTFRKVWLQFTSHTNGETLPQKHITSFFQALPQPRGMTEKDLKRPALAKEIMGMQLIGDGLGNVYFNELLYAYIKRSVGRQIFGKAKNDLNLELQLYLIKAEQETRNIIESNKNKEMKRKKFKYLPNRKNPINPLVTLLFNKMVFLAWKNYSVIKLADGETPDTIYEEEDSEIESSQSEEDYIENDNENDQPTIREMGDRIEEIEDDYSPSIKRPINLNIKLNEVENRPSHITSPLNSNSHSASHLRDQKAESSHNLSFQAENGRDDNLIYPQSGGQQQRIATSQNNGDIALLEPTQKQD